MDYPNASSARCLRSAVAGMGELRPEAERYNRRCLYKSPNGNCKIGRAGVACPVGLTSSDGWSWLTSPWTGGEMRALDGRLTPDERQMINVLDLQRLAVEWPGGGYCMVYEYINDLTVRDGLEEYCEALQGMARTQLAGALDRLDERFRAVTYEDGGAELGRYWRPLAEGARPDGGGLGDRTTCPRAGGRWAGLPVQVAEVCPNAASSVVSRAHSAPHQA